MSKFRHQGEPGGCDACRRDGTVYDDNGFQVCLCHDMMTVEKKARQLQRLRQLDEILRGKMPVVAQGGCTLSNNPVVGVYNITESTLLKELEARQITIPPKPRRRS